MKRTICLILTVLMICAVIPFAAFAEEGGQELPFYDIPEGKWYTKHVKFAYENGLMNGTGWRRFSPNSLLTRAQTAQIIYKIAGNGYKTDRVFYYDVPLGQWYSDAANWTHAIGAYFDSDTLVFNPGKRVTRAEFCKFVRKVFYARAKLQTVRSLAELDAVTNKDVDAEHKFAVEFAYLTGLISGKKTGSGADLAANDYITRAEAATIVHSLMNNLDLPHKALNIEKYGLNVSINLTYNGWLTTDYDPDLDARRSTLRVMLMPEDESAIEGAEIEVSGTVIPNGERYFREDFTTTRNTYAFNSVLSPKALVRASDAVILVNVTINGETFSFTEYTRVTHIS